jgi:DNA recombination protein RmuC
VELFLFGLVVGAALSALALGLFFTRRLQAAGQALLQAQQQKAAAEASLRELKEVLQKERDMEQRMKEAFQALSAQVLKSNSEEFLRRAAESLQAVLGRAEGSLKEHKAQVDAVIAPLQEALKRYEKRIHDVELKHTGLDKQLKMFLQSHQELQRQLQGLTTALRRPHVRGRWAEVQLRRVVELVGMVKHCDFSEQVSVSAQGQRLKPDMVIHLPEGGQIVVDAKCPEAIYDIHAAETEEARAEALKRHARNVQEHVKALSSKEYWKQFERSPELVVMFLSESSLAAALEASAELWEQSVQSRVLLATPTSLFALLSAVAYAWRQADLAESAQEIARLGQELYERLYTWTGHFRELGDTLAKAVRTYGNAVGSLEHRVLPSLRRFKELGIEGKDIRPLEPLKEEPRRLFLAEE